MSARMRFAVLILLSPLVALCGELPENDVASNTLRARSQARDLLNVPSGQALRARGARIGHVEIDVEEVFENTTGLAAPYRVANGLHLETHESTVQQQLLFQSGDLYDPRVIEETERLLRGQRYLEDAVIVPTRYNEDNTVDVLVRVHDVWTLSPGFSFGRKGGENNTRLKFEDTNFLGLGKEISLARSSDVDRTAWRLAYLDPSLLGSRWTLSTAYSSMSDGAESALALERPFYSLDTRWSASVAASDVTSEVSRYALGHAVDSFDMQRQAFEISAGVSEGLQGGWAKRYLAGYRYDARDFSQRMTVSSASVPDARVLSYPWVGLELVEDEYISTRNLDQIGRTEDLYLGRSARVELGFASSAFGSTTDALILSGSARAGADLGNERYLINTLGAGGRLQGSEIANAQIAFNSRYYQRQSIRRVFFASFTGALTSNLDPESQLLLGGDNGLRGYPLRYQAGTASALVTLEERFYTNWQPLKLVNVGAAVFLDAGRTWGRDAFTPAPAGWLADFGIGLRFGAARSGLGNVLHLDLAFPLNGPRDVDAMQLLIETRKSF